MQDFRISKKISGVSVCVSALKTQQSPFWGDFLALLTLGEWTSKCNLQIIQIRPVFDTGKNSDSCALVSAFALNPIYIRITALLREEGFQPQNIPAYVLLEKTLQCSQRSYADIRREKLNFLHNFFHENITEYPALTIWIQKNPWIIGYCAFCVLKDEHNDSSWKEWGNMACPSEEILLDFWKNRKKDCLFYAWLQYHLAKQFSQTAQTLTQMGIILKGEIPVEIAKESADVWGNRHLFSLHKENKTAGSLRVPYHWQHHRQEDFKWWKMRLANLEKYFELIQLDQIPCVDDRPNQSWPSFFKRPHEKHAYKANMCDDTHPLFHLIAKHTNLGICLGVFSYDSYLPDTLSRLRILPFKSPLYAVSQKKTIQKSDMPSHYPLLSVAALSTLDSPTLHQWWQETQDKSKFLKTLGLPEELSSESYNAETALAVLHAFITEANSCLVILQIQDYLSLCEQYREQNLPPHNKRQFCKSSYSDSDQAPQMKPALEELLTDRRFIFLVKVVNTPF